MICLFDAWQVHWNQYLRCWWSLFGVYVQLDDDDDEDVSNNGKGITNHSDGINVKNNNITVISKYVEFVFLKW